MPPAHASAIPPDAYASLRDQLQAVGCFDPQPGYYVRKTAMTAAGLAGVLAVALLADGVVLVLAAALALGVLSTQFGLLATTSRISRSSDRAATSPPPRWSSATS